MAVRHLKRYASWVQTVEEVIAKTFQVFVIVFSKFEPEELRLNLTKRHQSRRCVVVIQHDKLTNIGKTLSVGQFRGNFVKTKTRRD